MGEGGTVDLEELLSLTESKRTHIVVVSFTKNSLILSLETSKGSVPRTRLGPLSPFGSPVSLPDPNLDLPLSTVSG